ncbi:MAG: hypothetical protein MZV64_43740 [Ignavibacteriales bacterium]|nr:hypothetical protein [Ignavibacteriales bacterium]
MAATIAHEIRNPLTSVKLEHPEGRRGGGLRRDGQGPPRPVPRGHRPDRALHQGAPQLHPRPGAQPGAVAGRPDRRGVAQGASGRSWTRRRSPVEMACAADLPAGPGRRRQAAPGLPQRPPQRPRGPGARRQDRRLLRRRPRGRPDDGPGPHHRQRAGHTREGPAEHLRAVLHDQALRLRARPGQRPQDRRAAQRDDRASAGSGDRGARSSFSSRPRRRHEVHPDRRGRPARPQDPGLPAGQEGLRGHRRRDGRGRRPDLRRGLARPRPAATSACPTSTDWRSCGGSRSGTGGPSS